MMYPVSFLISIFSLLFAGLACQSSAEQPSESVTTFTSSLSQETIAYDFTEPDRRYVLPDKLREVSGLSYIGDDQLAMVQDEKGKLFFFHIGNEEVIEMNKFAQKGDYEGVEIVGDTAYALQSDGDVFRVARYKTEDPIVQKYENELRTKNDTEGLGYDPETHSLLIACKASPHLEEAEGLKGNRAVYAFSLTTKRIIPQPFLLVNLDSLRVKLQEGPLSSLSRKVIGAFGEDVTFKPSAIARHPITGHFWIISSVGKTLLVMDRQGNYLHVTRLRPGLFNHPEGICFSPAGTLFISNEGDDGVATVLRFRNLVKR